MNAKNANQQNNNFLIRTSGEIYASIAGILFTLAFAPFNNAYLALLALSMLFYTWHTTTPERALLRGYCFGLTSFGLGVSWVFVSMHDFGGANSLISGLLTALFVGFLVVIPRFGRLCIGKNDIQFQLYHHPALNLGTSGILARPSNT